MLQLLAIASAALSVASSFAPAAEIAEASRALRAQDFGAVAERIRLDNVPGVPAWEGLESIATAGVDEGDSEGCTSSAPVSGSASAGDLADAAPSRQLNLLPGLMTEEEICHLREIAFAEARGFDDSTLDTVDHQATYLCQVIEDGRPVDDAVCAALGPFLEGRLLPYVRQKFGCASACVANVLIRRYLPDERRRLESHFDVSAFATAIVPLSPRDAYAGGLYVQRVPGVTSRRYLNLEAGDCLVHRFDTMHGVHVPAGNRYSLVVWFSDSPGSLASGKAPWVERAAAAGNSEAAFVLGGFYYRGEFGYASDVGLAIRWLSRSAAAGNPLARLHIGSMLASGEVPSEDLPWLWAEHWRVGDVAEGRIQGGEGDSEAAATVEQEGEGRKLDAEALAARLYARAARQGHPSAEYAYGMALLYGQGVERDVTAGRRWLEKAASQGEAEVMAAGWAADALRAADAAEAAK